MKKKSLLVLVVMLFIATSIVWSSVSSGTAEKATKKKPPIIHDADEPVPVTVTVYLLAAASFKNNPVITSVDFNGSTPGNPALAVNGKVAIANSSPTFGIFVGVQDGKPVTIKVQTDDNAIATLTIPCATTNTTIGYTSTKYTVIPIPNQDGNAITFNFQPI